MSKPVIPARVRDWLYPIATAAGVVVGVYGLASEQEVAAWLGLVGAVLGTGTATAYRPSRTVPEGQGRHRADV